jgi:hypothetical protein
VTRFQPQVEIQTLQVPGLTDFYSSLNISNEQCNAEIGSADHLHLGVAEDNPLMSLKETEFPLKPFAKWMGYPSTVHLPHGIKYECLGMGRQKVAPLS